MVDDGGDFDAQPLGELAVLDAEIGNGLLLLDLGEELGQPIAFNDVATEPRGLAIVATLFRGGHLLLHVLVKISSAFPSNLVKLPLLFHALLVDLLSAHDIVNIIIGRSG